MDEVLDKAIRRMAEQSMASSQDADKSLKFSQAALNIAHVKRVISGDDPLGCVSKERKTKLPSVT